MTRTTARFLLIQLIALLAGAAVVGAGITIIVWWWTGTLSWLVGIAGVIVLLIRTVVFRAVYEIGKHLLWNTRTINRWHSALVPYEVKEPLKRHPKEDREEWSGWRE